MKERRNIIKVACLNTRGLNGESKKQEVGVMCKKRRIDVLGLSEMKLKGKGEVMFGNFKVLKSGVSERVRAREGVAIILNERLWKCVKESKFINSRLMSLKLKIEEEDTHR